MALNIHDPKQHIFSSVDESPSHAEETATFHGFRKIKIRSNLVTVAELYSYWFEA
jgi:hypothetical protein